MNCSWSEERFERFLDGELTPFERSRVVKHVDACPCCRATLEELRVVDALLLGARDIRLAPNFTGVTMAEAREIPAPRAPRTPLAAYLTCYLTASWLLIAAGCLLSPPWIAAVRATIAGAGGTLLETVRDIGHVAGRLADRGDVGAISAIVAAVLIADVMLVAAIRSVARSAPARIGNLRW